MGANGKVAGALLDDPALGRWIGARYRLVRVLGRGGMGAVYEAATADGGSFAVKIVRPDVPLRQDGLRRFARESRAAQQIENPHVARVVDAGTDEGLGLPFLVMERLEGRDLREALRDVGPLDPSCAARLFVQACQGLAAAHACGVVHRDIKPANLFLQKSATGEIVLKLCDFGVAKHVALPEDTGALTKSDGILGSPMYMSPEQSRNPRTVDHRSDIFSLGVTLYETLTGRSPWQGVSALDLVVAVCTTDAPPLASLAPWVPRGLAAAVHKAIARHPKHRFASADEFASALRPFVDSRESSHQLSGITTEQRRQIQVMAPTVAVTTAPGTEWTGDAVSAQRPKPRVRRRWIALALGMTLAGLAVAGASLARRPHRLATWAAGTRPTIAVPVGSADEHAPCPAWVPGALAQGLTAQLEASGGVRVIGPRELGAMSHASSANADVLRKAFGADAVVETECSQRGADGDAADVRLRVLSTRGVGEELSSVHVTGSALAPVDLVAKAVQKLRDDLALPAADPVEAARARQSLPESSDAARMYVEGLAKSDVFDAQGARPLLEDVVRREPQFAPGHAALASALAYLGQQRDAERESALAAQNASSLPTEERLLVEADAAAASNAWPQAIETYRAMAKVFPDRTDARLDLVNAYVKAGHVRDARAAVDALVKGAETDAGDPRVFLAAADVANLEGDSAATVEAARRAASLAHAMGMPAVEGRAKLAECSAPAGGSDLAQTNDACLAAEQIFDTLGDRADFIRVRARRIYVLSIRNDFDQATALAGDTLDLARRFGSHELLAVALGMRVNVSRRKGDLGHAIEDARASVAEADLSGMEDLQGAARQRLAGALLDSGARDEARRIYDESLAITERTGSERQTAVTHQNLSIYWMEEGDITQALHDAKLGLETEQRIGDLFDQPWALEQLASVQIEAGDPGAARELLESSMAMRTKRGYPIWPSRKNLAEALMLLGDLDGALREATAALDEVRQKSPHAKGEVETLDLLARVQLARGDTRSALETSEQGESLAHEIGTTAESRAPARARALFLAGRVSEAFASLKVPPEPPIDRRLARLVEGELLLRQNRGPLASQELQALQKEAHDSGHARVERAAAALLAGKLDSGFR